jgi:hypothetical protein
MSLQLGSASLFSPIGILQCRFVGSDRVESGLVVAHYYCFGRARTSLLKLRPPECLDHERQDDGFDPHELNFSADSLSPRALLKRS